MTADSSYSLESLERRWQVEKTPQVGLRLAEEYRRASRLENCIATLEAGLEVYPNHTASRVALSRYLVDGGRFLEAVSHLERIVALDPAHLVANKLLVGAYAGVGKTQEARDKLAIYEMMGEGDADIERLRELIEESERTAVSRPDRAPARAPGPSDPVTTEVSSAIPTPGAELLADQQRVAPGGVRGAGAAGPAAPAGGEDRPPVGPPPEPEVDRDPPEPAPAASQAPTADPFQSPVAAPGAATSAQRSEDEPFGTTLETLGSSSYWNGVADEGIFSLEESPEPDSASSSMSGVEDAEAAAAETPFAGPERPETAPRRAEEAAGAADSTVTLGRLYLDQGHRDEAAEVFKEVLAREPENQAARQQLEAAAEHPATDASRPPEVADSEVLGGRSEPSAGPTTRKREILTAYRARLRRAIAAGI